MKSFEGYGLGKSEGIGLGKQDGYGLGKIAYSGKEGWDGYSGTDSLGMKYPNV